MPSNKRRHKAAAASPSAQALAGALPSPSLPLSLPPPPPPPPPTQRQQQQQQPAAGTESDLGTLEEAVLREVAARVPPQRSQLLAPLSREDFEDLQEQAQLDWNEIFQDASDFASLGENAPADVRYRCAAMALAQQHFVAFATLVARRIVSEMSLPAEGRTFPPLSSARRVGALGPLNFGFVGERVVVGRVLFQVARDEQSVIGGDEFAGKAAACEVRGQGPVLTSWAPSLHTTLCALVRFRGHSVLATAIPPLHGEGASASASASASGPLGASATGNAANGGAAQEPGKKLHERVSELESGLQMIADGMNLRPRATVLPEKRNSASSAANGQKELRVTLRAITTQHLGSEVETHYGTDRRFYLTKLGRLLPAMPPPNPRSRETEFRRFRPEFLRQHCVQTRLAPDTFARSVSAADAEAGADSGARFSYLLREVVVTVAETVERVCEIRERESAVRCWADVLPNAAHCAGLSMRFVGRLLPHLRRRSARCLVLIEALIRSFKAIWRRLERRINQLFAGDAAFREAWALLVAALLSAQPLTTAQEASSASRPHTVAALARQAAAAQMQAAVLELKQQREDTRQADDRTRASINTGANSGSLAPSAPSRTDPPLDARDAPQGKYACVGNVLARMLWEDGLLWREACRRFELPVESSSVREEFDSLRGTRELAGTLQRTFGVRLAYGERRSEDQVILASLLYPPPKVKVPLLPTFPELSEFERELLEELAARERLLSIESPRLRFSFGRLAALYVTWSRDKDVGESVKNKAFELLKRMLHFVKDMAEKRLVPGLECASEFARVGHWMFRLGHFDEALGLHRTARDTISTYLNVKPNGKEASHAAPLAQEGLILQSMGRLDEALQCFQRSAEIVELYHGSRDPLLAQRRFDLAHVLELMGRFDDAVEQLRQVTSIMRGAAGAADRLALEAMERSGDVRVLMRDYEAAFALYHKAIDGWQCIVGPRHRRVAVLLCKVALMLCRAGEFDVARRYLERGSDILDQTLLPASSDHGLKLHVESLVLFYRDGLYEAALEKLRCSYDCVERVFSHVHVRVATLLADMARMNWVTGRVHEAADHFLWTANCLDRCVHADHVLRMEALLNLGRAQMALGRWKEAEENLSLAARWDRSQPHPAWVAAVVPRVRASLAALLLARGRRAEADEQLGRYFSSRDLAGAQYQRREILESSTVYDVAATMVEKGFPKQALLMQKQRVQLLERAGREYESDLSWALVKKGELQLQLGERAAAFESISRGVLGVCAEQYADTALAGPTAALIVHCAGAGDLSRIEYLLPRLSEMWARLERSGSEGGRAGLEARQFQVASALGDAGLVTYAAPLLQRVVTRWEANPKMARTSTLEHARTLLSRMQSSASGDPALRLTMQQKEEQQPQQHQQQQQQRRSLPYVAAALRPALGATHAPLPADDYGASASSVAASVRSHADSGAPVPTLDGDDGEGGARGKATSTTLLAAPRPFTFAEQLQAMGDAVALRRRTGAKSPLEGEPDQQGAKALLASGKYEEALKQLQDWLDAPDAHSDWEVSWTHTRAAEALRHLGRAREALDHLLKAIVHAECMHTSNRASVVALLVEDATDLLLSLDRCEDAFELVLTRWPKAAAEAVKAGGSTAVF